MVKVENHWPIESKLGCFSSDIKPFESQCMDQRDCMPLMGSASYYLHRGTTESVTGLQSPPSMSPLSNAAMHFHSNTGGSLTVPTLPLDTSSTMLGHGVVGPPSTMQQGEPVRRKRGRPRKYGHDGAVSLALSPSVSNAAPMRPTQKWRGRPPGSGSKPQLSSLVGTTSSGAGTMTPHIIQITAGEDIKRKILSLLQARKAIVILSAIGSISSANIRTSSSRGSVTYEGHFDMVNLSGSYVNDVDGAHGPTGGINVTFAGPDGRLIGGPVDGVLIAASPVQVILGILAPNATKTKIKSSEDPEASGDPDRSFGSLLTPSNAQASQNLNPLGVWQSSR